MSSVARVDLIRLTMDAMVPLRMWELRRKPLEVLEAMAPDLADYISGHGDEIEHGGDHQGQGLGKLATAISVLALIRPEGVNLFGGHWCSDHTAHQEDIADD